jgi:hypothetical protein
MPQKCELYSFCKALQGFLLKLGIGSNEIATECKGHFPCKSIDLNTQVLLQYTDATNTDAVMAWVKRLFGGKLPVENSTNVMDKMIHNPPFRCPEINLEIYQPCSIQSCSFHTNNVWTRNCILNYRVDHYCDALDLKELAFLLELPLQDLKARVNNILAKTRKWALKSKIEQEGIADYAPVETKGMCCVCGREVVVPNQIGEYLYCGVLCSSRKPPYCIDAEKNFHLPVERILTICVNSFASVRPICHALGLSQVQLQHLCRQHHVDIANLPL